MIRKSLIISIAASTAFLIAGCDDSGSTADDASATDNAPTASDVAREASDAASTAGQFAQAQVDEYIDEARKGVEAVNTSIENLGQRVENMTGEAKIEAQRTLDDLRARRDAYLEELDEASADSAQAWEDVKSGLDRAWSDLESAAATAMDRFAPDERSDNGTDGDD